MYLCQLSGIPGTGKSTLARYIGRLTGSVIIDMDTIKSAILSSFENNIDFKFAGKVSYDIVFALADNYLELGQSVVIDSPCGYDIILERGNALTKKHNASYKFIECYLTDLAELNRRRTVREIKPSQIYSITIDEREFQDSYDKLKRPSNHVYLSIDTGQGIDKCIATIIDYLTK